MDISTVPTPDLESVPSLLVCVGKEHYKLHEVLAEYGDIGVSKRIPKTAIPEGMVKLVSKIFVAYPEAILKVTKEGSTLFDLALYLYEMGLLSDYTWDELMDNRYDNLDAAYWEEDKLNPEDFVPESMLQLASAFSKLLEDVRAEAIKEFGIKFQMGIVGYSYFQGFQYVVKPGEDGLPEDLAHLEGYVEPITCVYDEDEEEKE